MKLRLLSPLPFLLGAAGLSAAAPAASPAPVEGYHFVQTVGAISAYTLDANGLQVLLLPDHSAPVITYQVTYRVGSRNEVTGTTGATHLLEHLMFKGSTHFNRELGTKVDQILDPIGATNNASTWVDRTNYHETFGAEHLPLIVRMEADRMRGLLLRDSDRQPEMTVVRNEFERGENSPFQALMKEITAAAYVAHPYHHSTIGWRSDIEQVSTAKLREFYDTYYWPDNATVSVVGDFQPAAALALVRQHYAAIPRAPKPIPQLYTQEPEQTGPRRVVVKRAGRLGVVGIGHKIPAATHPDAPAITVLSLILTDGKNSRLYRAITDQSLSTGVSGFPFPTHDPSLHFTFIPLAPGAKHEAVEQLATAQIERLKQDGVTAAEVQAAIAKYLADSAFQRDGTYAIADNLNTAIAVGDWTMFYRFDEGVRQVTAADVQRVARKYFNEDQSTTGWFVPLAPAAPPAAAAK